MRKTMSPRILLLALAPVLLAASEPGDADPLAGAQTVPDEVLAAQRGGFAFQGMVIAFGADIRSYVNDELALRPIVSWKPEGPTIERFVTPSLPALAHAPVQGGLLTSGGISLPAGAEAGILPHHGPPP